MPASWATSSRRSPVIRRRVPAGSPTSPGVTRPRQARRNAASSVRSFTRIMMPGEQPADPGTYGPRLTRSLPPPVGRRQAGRMTIALITGANKGIGFEIARQLGTGGATVLLGSRDAARGKAAAATLPDIDVHVVQVDVTSGASIAAAAAWIDATHGRLDVLVNNAGIAVDREYRPSTVPLDTLRATYETNVFGVVAVTNGMLPLLRRSPAGRIVNLSSALASLTMSSQPEPPWGRDLLHLAYMSSKTALNAVTLQYAAELRDTPILVNAADPGYCATDLNDWQGFQSAAEGARIVVELATLPAGGPSGTFRSATGPVPW